MVTVTWTLLAVLSAAPTSFCTCAADLFSRPLVRFSRPLVRAASTGAPCAGLPLLPAPVVQPAAAVTATAIATASQTGRRLVLAIMGSPRRAGSGGTLGGWSSPHHRLPWPTVRSQGTVPCSGVCDGRHPASPFMTAPSSNLHELVSFL